MSRGPNASPYSVRGRAAAKRGSTPQPVAGRPQMPEWFVDPKQPDKETPLQAIWNQLCDTLEELQLLATCDWGSMERYCCDLVMWRDCMMQLQRVGLTYMLRTTNPDIPHIAEDPTNKPNGPVKWITMRVRNPEFAAKQDLEKSLRSFEQAFGLSPGARTRLSIIGTAEADDVGEAPQTVKFRKRG